MINEKRKIDLQKLKISLQPCVFGKKSSLPSAEPRYSLQEGDILMCKNFKIYYNRKPLA